MYCTPLRMYTSARARDLNRDGSCYTAREIFPQPLHCRHERIVRFKESTLERDDFQLQLLMLVTLKGKRKLFLSFLSRDLVSYCPHNFVIRQTVRASIAGSQKAALSNVVSLVSYCCYRRLLSQLAMVLLLLLLHNT